MPELPEVETVRRQLARVLEGAQITGLKTSKHNYFFVTPPRALKTKLVGRTVERLERHGKYLIAHLDDDSRLLLHLGMTGQFVAGTLPHDAHIHVILQLSNQHSITLRDVRKFGKIEFIAAGKTSKRLNKLGPDALSTSHAWLTERLGTRRIPIKTAVLDQSIWAGVGNIYADEALYRCKIAPERLASRLKSAEIRRLLETTQTLLKQAIEQGGSTINDYIRPDGELGGFQDFHQVYGKTGEPCPQCGQPIVRVVLGGRSTHFCKKCQR